MIGQLNISMFFYSDRQLVDNGSYHSPVLRGKRVRLVTYHCEHEECDRKISEFAEANPVLWGAMQKHIFAEWVGRDFVRCP